MTDIEFKVGSVYCLDCVIALRKFIGHMKGVESVEMVEEDKVAVRYEPSDLEFGEDKLKQIIDESVDKLGFKILE